MVKVMIFYDSKYGNTKIAAEKVAEGLRNDDISVDLGYVKEVSAQHAIDYDAIILGAPNHMGRPSQTMKKFLGQIAMLDLKEKTVALFGTYAGKARPLDRAVRKMEIMVHEKLPKLVLLSPSLSIRVNGVSGPIMDNELPKCVEFGRLLASQLK